MMKTVVLAGGYATRLWPVAGHRPKMLFPIGKTTTVDRIFEGCERHDTIIDRETRIEDDLAGALIGAHTQLRNGDDENE